MLRFNIYPRALFLPRSLKRTGDRALGERVSHLARLTPCMPRTDRALGRLTPLGDTHLERVSFFLVLSSAQTQQRSS